MEKPWLSQRPSPAPGPKAASPAHSPGRKASETARPALPQGSRVLLPELAGPTALALLPPPPPRWVQPTVTANLGSSVCREGSGPGWRCDQGCGGALGPLVFSRDAARPEASVSAFGPPGRAVVPPASWLPAHCLSPGRTNLGSWRWSVGGGARGARALGHVQTTAASSAGAGSRARESGVREWPVRGQGDPRGPSPGSSPLLRDRPSCSLLPRLCQGGWILSSWISPAPLLRAPQSSHLQKPISSGVNSHLRRGALRHTA